MRAELGEPAELNSPLERRMRQFIPENRPPARWRLEHFRQYRVPARCNGRVHIHKVESREPRSLRKGGCAMSDVESKGFWLGVDVGQERLEVAAAPMGVEPNGWRPLRTHSFANSSEGLGQLVAHVDGLIRRNGALWGICVESTGPLSGRLARHLARLRPSWPAASIINPKRSVDFARSTGARNKNDRIDAAILAVYGAIYKPPAKAPLADGYATLRELYRVREGLLDKKQDLANMLRTQDNPLARRPLQEAIKALHRQIVALEQLARQAIEDDPALRRDLALLTSIRGIGFVVSWALLAELGDLRQYSRAQIVAYAGIYARQHDSGKTVHLQPRLVKGGCRRLRKALYNAARALFRSKNNSLRRYLDRLLQAGKKPMHCIIALMRKLLLIARSVLIHGVPYDPNFAQG